jgi:SNF2 family DNA or RNA helicase
MSTLEDLQPNAAVRGILPDALVTVVSVQWFGSEALELTYKHPTGRVANELLYRHDEARLDVVEQGRPWSFDGDGHLFRLVSEAYRIRLAHLFDPVLAVHTSLIDPLPHQITAVYEAMLPRQPLRFLLADDPGAGKIIMAGLLIKELIVRGDLQRCLVVCPGSLAEQWQDELSRRFQLPFDILTNDKLEAARIGNWFLENHLVIARLDKLARNEDVQQKLQAPDCRWDLVVCDEAHKLSATFFGGEIQYTRRYKLGQLLAPLTRHFLLMTATYQSLRRRERLEKRCRELELLQRGAVAMTIATAVPTLDAEDVEDLEEAPDHEVEAAEAEILDQATAARTIDELKAEIATLGRLEALAGAVRRSGKDRKWRELAGLLSVIFTPAALANQVAEDPALYCGGTIPPPTPSPRQKLVIFTEHRDTLSYLDTRVSTLLGRKEAVVVIHGGMGREERLKAQESFRHDPEVQVLLATDAAGEGINLQRAHLMVNYDLPWNPNRLEQRFGRIHRIGQTEVCHLWNLVAEETREGDVYRGMFQRCWSAILSGCMRRRATPKPPE